MVCLGCHTVTTAQLCSTCRASIHHAADRLLPGGLRLIAAFEHERVARTLVHHLKYRGVTAYARLVADVLATRVPPLPLVPIPRALSRRLKYGVDPAREIAGALSRRMGVPVVDALVPHLHAPRRAGRDHSRSVQPFRSRSVLRSQVVIVDDVVTTGATITAAVDAIGAEHVRVVVAANAVPDTSNVAHSD